MVNMRKAIKLFFFRRKWRKNNKNNYSVPMNIFPIENVKVGNKTYGQLNVIVSNINNYLSIGHFCSIADKCEFILSGEHPIDNLSTYPFKVKVLGEKYEALSKGNIIVEDDVWLGYGAIVLSGVTIGRGSIVAAGSVVTKDVPPYAIVAGNPAHIIKYRFGQEIIDRLMMIDYSKWDDSFIGENISQLYTNVNELKEDQLELFIK